MEDSMKHVRPFGYLVVMLLMLLIIPCIGIKAQTVPDTHMLFYQILEYDAKVGDSVVYFFKNMLKPEDDLVIFSPTQPYQFSQKTRQAYSVDDLIKRTQDVLKRDTSVGANSYREIHDSMTRIILDINELLGFREGGMSSPSSPSVSDMKSLLTQYRQLLESMRSQRKLSEPLFLKFAEMFKTRAGQKHLYIIYQQRFRVIPSKEVMETIRENPDFAFDAGEVFVLDNPKDFMDVDKVAQALKDSAVKIHLIYVNSQEKRSRDYRMSDFSADIYGTFSKLANATGGMVVSTSKVEAALKKIHSGK